MLLSVHVSMGRLDSAHLQLIVYLVEIQQTICRWQLVKKHRLLKQLSYVN